MLDASKFDIVMAGVNWCQGKYIVNSISLKEGEEKLKENATLLSKHGAAIVVMAFDKVGQVAADDDKTFHESTSNGFYAYTYAYDSEAFIATGFQNFMTWYVFCAIHRIAKIISNI